MIYGIGTDLVDIKRIKKLWLQFGDKFAQRILTDAELTASNFYQRKSQVKLLAKRFAAKEAVVKALGTGFRLGIGWHDIIISSDSLQKPRVNFEGAALDFVRRHAIDSVLLSISDEKHLVMAFAVATKMPTQ